jgi:hypothetical protein
MRIKRFCATIAWFVCYGVIYFTNASFAPAHPFYVSVTEINIKPAQQRITVACKMFTDDLQEAIYKTQKKQTNFDQQTQQQLALLEQYINARFELAVASKPMQLQVIGYETEGEATWCYMEASRVVLNQPAEVAITTTLLCDFLPTQANLIHCRWDTSPRKSYKLDCSKTNFVFTF